MTIPSRLASARGASKSVLTLNGKMSFNPDMPKKNSAVAKPAATARSSADRKITTSSTAEYFSKNLQQVGFSSQTKAVLTTLKEAVDNALDACEEAEILPDVFVSIEKVGT